MKKCVLLGLSCALLCPRVHCFKCIDDLDPKARLAGGFAISAVALACGSALAKSDVTKTVAPFFNMSSHDMGAVFGITATLAAASCFCEKNTRGDLRSWAWQVPVLALAISAMQSKTFNSLLRHTPLLGKYLACKERDCKGICQDCKCRKGVVQTFMWSALIQQIVMNMFSKNA